MFRQKRSEIDDLIKKYGGGENSSVTTPSTPHELSKIIAKYRNEGTLLETSPIDESNERWIEFVEKSYNGVPLCRDGDSGESIRFAPALEDIILNRVAPPEMSFNPNTINFRAKDIVNLLGNFPSYLEFLRKNYTLATTASALGNKIDSPEFPFFNQISGLVNLIGFVGANPVLAKKLYRFKYSQKLESEGKAPLEIYLPDQLLDLYQKILFERRATKIEMSSIGKIIAVKSDSFLRGTLLTEEEFLNLPAIGAIVKIKQDELAVATTAGEEPGGLLTKGAKATVNFVRKIPIVGRLI